MSAETPGRLRGRPELALEQEDDMREVPKWERTYKPGWTAATIYDGDGNRVAKVGALPGEECPGLTTEKVAADSALLTAAPKLYEQCRLLRMALTTDGARIGYCARYGEKDWRRTVEAVDAVLRETEEAMTPPPGPRKSVVFQVPLFA